jgi:hypothetical protein
VSDLLIQRASCAPGRETAPGFLRPRLKSTLGPKTAQGNTNLERRVQYCGNGHRPVAVNSGVINMMKIALRKISHSLAVLAALLLPALSAAPAHAQIFHTWVSHGGNDGSFCSSAVPCLTISHALSQTHDPGEVSCLDSGSFDQFTITTSVVIDCSGTVATPYFDSTVICLSAAISINAPGKVVTLRGLHVTSSVSCGSTSGILIQAATAVTIEDCVIENFGLKGILDQRTTGLTKLVIKNTVVRNNGSAGIVAGAAPRNSVVLENVQSVGNTYGIAVATGNNVVISRSVMSENSIAGIEADPGADVVVENTKISHNASYGVFAQGTITLANSDISFNSASISGTTMSYGNNRLFGNGAGDAPTLISQQ